MMREPQHTQASPSPGKPLRPLPGAEHRVLPATPSSAPGHAGRRLHNVFFEPETGFVLVITNNGSSQARDHGTIVLAQRMLRYLYPIFSEN